MRLENHTLDGLSASQFAKEVEMSVAAIEEGGAREAEKLAKSFGLQKEWTMRRGRFASVKTAKLTDEFALNLVKKKNQLIFKLQEHMDKVVEGLENAEMQIKGMHDVGQGDRDASIILQKNVVDKVEDLRRFCVNILKQLE